MMKRVTGKEQAVSLCAGAGAVYYYRHGNM